MEKKSNISLSEVIQKLEYYCSYQERCHQEVRDKLKQFQLTSLERDTVVVHLIDHNYLNEERYAELFAISKFHQKFWGKKRITSELKARYISAYLITKALNAIPEDEYQNTFLSLAERHWNSLSDTDLYKKRKKCCDFMLRKGWESDKVLDLIMNYEL
ncbi:regulatory protein RecX [Flavobacterium sp. SUN046]|uniref:regulatory protein RecX n=1 Tax=Flavobacterium sp. SUN046 TaxID=3002440 RepID=UPI002DB6DAC6|nr:regulatory protein RecX [Flavobacterium sp. SUN046]MEC4051037.1 regulatory protein RecX [Flavobacterium sp. SUN046]